MKIEEPKKKSFVKDIIIALITNEEFVKKYYELFNNKHIFTKDVGLSKVENWCLEHYVKYNRAINKDMRSKYESEVQKKCLNEAELELISAILSSLSKRSDEELSDCNVDYLIDRSIEEANRRMFEGVSEELSNALSTNNVERAKEIVNGIKAIENKEVEFVDLLNNKEYTVEKYFEEAKKDVVSWDGDIGKAFKGIFTKSSLVLLRGAAKSKKSRMSNFILNRAVLMKKKVALFQLGDLTDSQVVQRYVASLIHKPISSYSEPVSVPVLSCLRSIEGVCNNINCLNREPARLSDGTPNPSYKPCTYCRSVNKPFPYGVYYRQESRVETASKELVEGAIDMIAKHVGSDGGLRVLNYSAGTFSATDIYDTLKSWAEDGWVADVVVVDSENLCKAEVGFSNKAVHDVVAERFKVFNKIRKELECCLVVCDQARGRTQGLDGMSTEDYSGGADKNRYCTAVVEMNTVHSLALPKVQVITISNARDGSYLYETGGVLLMFQDLSVEDMCVDSIIVTKDLIDIRNHTKEELGLVDVVC